METRHLGCIAEKSGGHVVLNSEGARICRDVTRLASNMQWNQQALLEARCLPWNLLAGVENGKKNDVRGAPLLERTLEDPNEDGVPVVMVQNGQPQDAGAETDSEAGPDSPSSPVPPAAAPLSVASSLPAAPTPKVNPSSQEGISAVDTDRGDKRKADDSPPRSSTLTGADSMMVTGEASISSIEHGPPDPKYDVLADIEDAAKYYAKNHRSDLRWAELNKLQQLQCFEVIPKAMIGQTKILTTTWVDSDTKSRLAVRDLKKFGATEEITHCPTPSSIAHRIIEYFAVINSYMIDYFDIVSAFPHAPESSEWVIVRPPQEFVEAFLAEVEAGKRPDWPAGEIPYWRMLRSLYGRRSAGANFRDLFQGVLLDIGFVRSDHDPCLYSWQRNTV
jgi:hypothetical protein